MSTLEQIIEILADGKLWSIGDLMRETGNIYHQTMLTAIELDGGERIKRLEIARPKKVHGVATKYYYKLKGT